MRRSAFIDMLNYHFVFSVKDILGMPLEIWQRIFLLVGQCFTCFTIHFNNLIRFWDRE